ncbi:adenylyltransferase/cytidyltransferase family protein [Synechococcus sp. LA31]|uniref:adenylyltransferase/cytidyltransferase family protein n=1 Tax=Synechococcus sp. LA31 TaxID=2741953 RepID=UPI001BDC87AA|nr:adenylyltransferase/cytidyltransferase family protein [Synechococcus sp. LA31]QVV68735.1 adenylyltransferase/cytidyltransferase family protein [Synechococcus sp. LA31]
MIIGYTAGVFDLFHVGHVNLLRNAKMLCDRLIVAVSTNELVKYKNKQPVIDFNDRVEVVKACCYVDLVVPQHDLCKIKAHDRYKFNTLFVGDDWLGTPEWKNYEERLLERSVQTIYFPYTKSVSSTLINQILTERRT